MYMKGYLSLQFCRYDLCFYVPFNQLAPPRDIRMFGVEDGSQQRLSIVWQQQPVPS